MFLPCTLVPYINLDTSLRLNISAMPRLEVPPIHAETCSRYWYLTSNIIMEGNIYGAKWVFNRGKNNRDNRSFAPLKAKLPTSICRHLSASRSSPQQVRSTTIRSRKSAASGIVYPELYVGEFYMFHQILLIYGEDAISLCSFNLDRPFSSSRGYNEV